MSVALALQQVANGSYRGDPFLLQGNEVLVGRGKSCNLQLHHDEVSKQHAKLVNEGEWSIQDSGSTNGTFFNGQRLEARRTIAAGDTIRFGPLTFQVVVIPPSERPTVISPPQK